MQSFKNSFRLLPKNRHLYSPFADEPISTIDELIRYCKSGDIEDERPSTSRGAQSLNSQVNLLGQTLAPGTNSSFGRFLTATSPLSPLVQNGVNVACSSQSAPTLAPLHHSPVANVLQQQQLAQPDLQQLFGNPHLAAQGSAVASVFAQQRKQLNDLQQQQQILHAQQLLQKHSPAHHQLGMTSMLGPSSVYNGACKCLVILGDKYQPANNQHSICLPYVPVLRT
jgi:hypothetical protein